MMGDSLTRDSREVLSEQVRDRERPYCALSPLSMSELPAAPGSTIRFLSPKLGAHPASVMQVHKLDVESPSATLQRKKRGGGIVYQPPENLAEYLDCGLVPPVSGGSSTRGSERHFFDAHDALDDVLISSQGTGESSASTKALSPETPCFYCAFCMRNRPATKRQRFEGNGGCTHEFCKECLEDYLYQRIRVGHHSLHPCPKVGEEGCCSSSTLDDVRRIVQPDVYEEHRRRVEGLSGPCEACGLKGRRPSAPPGLASTPASSRPADAQCQSCGSIPTRTGWHHGSPSSSRHGAASSPTSGASPPPPPGHGTATEPRRESISPRFLGQRCSRRYHRDSCNPETTTTTGTEEEVLSIGRGAGVEVAVPREAREEGRTSCGCFGGNHDGDGRLGGGGGGGGGGGCTTWFCFGRPRQRTREGGKRSPVAALSSPGRR